jgi:hypothetical protein
MAVMIPNQTLDDRAGSSSERLVFDALRDTLSDDYYVYHSLPYIEPSQASQGEADFLVLHPHKGMLVIECKGWGVVRESDGSWYREQDDGRRMRLTRSPSEQARKHVEDLVEKFRKPLQRICPHMRGRFPLVYGWAIALPRTRWGDDDVPPELERALVFDSSDLADLGSRVERAFSFYARKFDHEVPSMEQAAFRRFRTEAVSPSVNLAPKLAGQIEAERQAMVQLTQGQTRIVRSFMENPRICVAGGAGTGKTVLAAHCAQQLAIEGKDVLLLCFNKNLGNHLKKTVDAWPKMDGSVHATHFHSLCASADRKLDKVLDWPSKDASKQDKSTFWRDEAPLALLQAVDEGKLGGWDAIIVDEGQDFAPSWWGVLEPGLADPNESTLAVFYDDCQRIFDHGAGLPEYPKVRLFENFRNPRAITKKLRELVDVDMEPHFSCIEGEEPRVYQQPNPAKAQRLVKGLLDELVDREGLTPDQIAILSPHTPYNSVLEGAAALGKHKLVHDPQKWSSGVLHTSISGFKGLEADVVIITDVDPKDARCTQKARYVAASRARNRLYVFAKGNWLAAGEPKDAASPATA